MLVRVSGRCEEAYLGILEPGLLGQARNGEVVDKESGPVGAKAEPEDEGDEAHDGEEAEEDSAEDFGDARGEAVAHALHVVAGGVVAAEGLGGLLGGFGEADGDVAVGAVHFTFR